MADNLISVTQFNTYIKQIFDAEEMLKNITIFGEVSGFGITRGTAYFNIKDADAMLACVKFGMTESSYCPKDGDMVMVRGSPNYYVKGGRFSFNVNKIEPYGLGVLYAKFLELKNKLENEGLFSQARKKAIPQYVRRIGVVTSSTGAVIQDIIDITRRRNSAVDIVLFPAKVQGVGAEQEICEGLMELDKTDVDVIIIARGGGSAEDLSPFNTEQVARAIAGVKKPLVSAIGHETDFTIADFVADLRAPTPSAAAELVVFEQAAELNRLSVLAMRAGNVVQNYFANKTAYVEAWVRRFASSAKELQQTRVSRLRELGLALNQGVVMCVNERNNAFKILTKALDAHNPLTILKSGYARISIGSKLVSSVNDIKLADDINIKLSDGNIDAKVEKIGGGK